MLVYKRTGQAPDIVLPKIFPEEIFDKISSKLQTIPKKSLSRLFVKLNSKIEEARAKDKEARAKLKEARKKVKESRKKVKQVQIVAEEAMLKVKHFAKAAQEELVKVLAEAAKEKALFDKQASIILEKKY